MARALASRVRLTLLVAPVSWMNRLRLTAVLPATACSALATCSSMPCRVRRARSARRSSGCSWYHAWTTYGTSGIRAPRMNDNPAASMACWLAAEIMPASATTVTSASWWASMNARMVGSIVVVSPRLPSNALTINGNPLAACNAAKSGPKSSSGCPTARRCLATALSASHAASSCAEPMCSMSRDPRREECTICTALAPDAVFTVCAYATRDSLEPAAQCADFRRSHDETAAQQPAPYPRSAILSQSRVR